MATGAMIAIVAAQQAQAERALVTPLRVGDATSEGRARRLDELGVKERGARGARAVELVLRKVHG
jgi:hypothetical protein